jgi:hypothetical protein
MRTVQACIDRTLLPTGEETYRLTALRDRLWRPDQRTLHVRFLGGHAEVHRRVREAVREWEHYAGIAFIFDGHPNAQIRISFEPGSSWSFVGNDALNPDLVGPTGPTLNFGWLVPGVSDIVLRQVVLHEFGHVLGLVHEHQSPNAGIPWDKEAVYRFYAGPPNHWSKADVEINVLQRYARTETNASAYDRDSIMLYPIPAELTIGGYCVGWNTALSETDKHHIAQLYPQVKVR